MEVLSQKEDCKFCVYKAILFKELTGEELDYVNQSRKEMLFHKGELITTEGEEITQFLYLKRGLVKLFKTGDLEKERIINIAKPMDFVSLLSIFSNTTYKYSIAALEDSVVCSVDIKTIKELIIKNGNFALDVLQRMSKMSDDIIETRYNINNKQLRGRIAYILNFFSIHIYHSQSFELPISRREIAELINMTTENVIRILAEFRKDGIISIDGKKISIENTDMLETICKLG